MTDLLQVLPDFETRAFTHLLPSLDRALITTNDLLTLDAHDVAKRAQLPAGELRKLVDAIVPALHQQLGFGSASAGETAAAEDGFAEDGFVAALAHPQESWRSISTLDDNLDAALGGGIPPGYLIEVTGESGAGKTQLLLTLLLAVQLPAPRGLARTAVYISTEAVLSTTRLAQLLSSHPALSTLAPSHRPSLANVLAIQTPDLESQEHILRYQLPVAITKHNVGLVILDSVAANYRAEFEKRGPSNGAASMAKRGAQLVQLGALLRDLARTHDLSVVVANQVADRFANPPPSHPISRNPSSTNSQSTRDTTPQPASQSPNTAPLLLSPDPLALDHQQRWFTGWGASSKEPPHTLKTPSLGLVWTNQLAARIALVKKPVFASRTPLIHAGTVTGTGTVDSREEWPEHEETYASTWQRWARVVFAPWTPASEGRGVEFEITREGIRSADADVDVDVDVDGEMRKS